MQTRSLYLISFLIAFGLSPQLQAGSLYLTGHDVLLHSGQRGYDRVILDYLRGAGTTSEIAVGSYRVGYLTSGGTSGGLASVTAEGFSVTTADPTTFANSAAFGAWLSGFDVMVYPWYYDNGAAGMAAVNSFADVITEFFNAGGDIWANASHTFTDYYNFLPPAVAASGPALAGNPSSGFSPTAAGAAIGITDTMVNGDPTHNVFDAFDPAFTVFERYSTGAVISIGLRDAKIVVCDPLVDKTCFSGGSVPTPASFALFGLGATFLGLVRCKRKVLGTGENTHDGLRVLPA